MTDEFNRIPGGTARNVLEYLARQLVDEPDDVVVEVSEGRPVRLTLRVAPNDVGRVIGRHGRTAQAMRAIARAAAVREGSDIFVDIAD